MQKRPNRSIAWGVPNACSSQGSECEARPWSSGCIQAVVQTQPSKHRCAPLGALSFTAPCRLGVLLPTPGQADPEPSARCMENGCSGVYRSVARANKRNSDLCNGKLWTRHLWRSRCRIYKRRRWRHQLYHPLPRIRGLHRSPPVHIPCGAGPDDPLRASERAVDSVRPRSWN